MLGRPLTDNSHFCTCCPLSGHRWIAILIVNDRPLSLFNNLPLLLTSSISLCISLWSLLLIILLLFISGYFYPSPGPVNPCSICTHLGKQVSTMYQLFSMGHLSCSLLSLSEFRKVSQRHFWTCS